MTFRHRLPMPMNKTVSEKSTKYISKCWERSVKRKSNFSFIRAIKSRSSHQTCFVRKGVLRNFAKLTGKHLCQSLFFNKVAGLRDATLLKKRLWHSWFPASFAKFVRTPFIQKTSRRLLMKKIIFWQTCRNRGVCRAAAKKVLLLFTSSNT